MKIVLTILNPLAKKKEEISINIDTYEDIVSFLRTQYLHLFDVFKHFSIIKNKAKIPSQSMSSIGLK